MTQHKRGATFDYSGQIKNNGVVQDMTGWTPTCELKRTDGDLTLVQALSAAWLDATLGQIRISATALQTEVWPLETLQFDIRLEDGAGNVVYSDTQTLDVVERITDDN